jgi:hypothetical protein
MGSRSDQWIHWTYRFQLRFITIVHTFNCFLVKDLSCPPTGLLPLGPTLQYLISWILYSLSLSPQSVASGTLLSWLKSESYVTTDGQSTILSWNKAPIWGLRPDLLLLSDSCGFVDVGRSLWREDGSVVYICCWSLPEQSFSGPSPVGLPTMFYCLRFETSLFTTRRATVKVFDPASTQDV